MAQKKRTYIVGNWKMNPDTLDEAKALLARSAKAGKANPRVNVVIAPPAPFMAKVAGKEPVAVAAQDVSDKPRGSFTGSYSAFQVKAAGATYAIIGHSERRAAGDTDAVVVAKAKLAIEAGLRVILCVGESARDEQAHYLRAVREQIITVITAVAPRAAKNFIIAYEPVWAIGKSFDVAPKPRDIQEMAIYIKKVCAEALGTEAGVKIPVLYGGAVSADSAPAMMKDGGIDGLLVGRQSLDVDAFQRIVEAAA